MNNRGFTLIELPIVIAIIGILAGTVIVSLSGETDQARDATTKLAVSSLRTPALSEQYKSPIGLAVCKNVRAKIKGGTDSIDAQWTSTAVCPTNSLSGSVTTDVGKICCYSSGSSWVIWGRLSEDNKYWCTDHNGTTKEVTNNSSIPVNSTYTCK